MAYVIKARIALIKQTVTHVTAFAIAVVLKNTALTTKYVIDPAHRGKIHKDRY
jgi:hypothetical protein